ncbi:MAG TPA: lysine--tRNA ligase [Lachnospiraceae bacterium]|nr:lysine--tRNA ligase [Lachnospiraceae bacterium]HCY09021.1 lysine--tRNA ligase [Lachnospiraceae bacterium]
MADTQNTNVQEQDIHQLLKVKREKLANLQQAGKDPFQITKYDVTHHSTDIKNNFEELEGKTVRIAGRVMSKRVMGKASFCNVQDLPGNIQVYVARDSIGEESYADFKKYDVGDIVGIEGEVFKTKTGEISVHASQVTLLSKSLQILPEKFHGLTNTDIRYRQRYTDLIMNQDVKDTFVKRSKIISAIRRYLDGQGFLEVETPMLVSNAGGAAARPFETHYNALDEDVKLRISLELYLKRLIVGGMERVFEIGRVFRNEGLDTRHNPEFTLMELYQAYTDYYGMMDLTENMFRYVAQEVCGTTVIPYAEETIDLGKPFERLTMVDAVKKYAGVDFDQIPDTAAAKKLADEKGVHYEERHAKGDILNLFFEEFVEEHLIQPVFIMDHPVEISPLTKRKPDKPDYVERFELFIYGREMCNAYSELNDPIDQRERFKAQEAALAAGDEEANTTDEDFMNALEIGMPPTGGIGYGIDRLVMLLTNSPAIRDVLLFPTMKPLNGVKDENGVSSEAVEAPKAEPEKIDFSKVEIEPLFKDFVDFETFSKSDFRAVKVLACEAVPKSKKLLKFTLDDGTGENRTILSGIHAYYEPEELVGKTCIAIVNLPPRPMMGIDSCGMLISAVHHEEGEEKLHLLMVDDHIPAGAKLY